jgi:hypothetical protein
MEDASSLRVCGIRRCDFRRSDVLCSELDTPVNKWFYGMLHWAGTDLLQHGTWVPQEHVRRADGRGSKTRGRNSKRRSIDAQVI